TFLEDDSSLTGGVSAASSGAAAFVSADTAGGAPPPIIDCCCAQKACCCISIGTAPQGVGMNPPCIPMSAGFIIGGYAPPGGGPYPIMPPCIMDAMPGLEAAAAMLLALDFLALDR
ncbi:MAG: hypothetical protein SGARI_006680, partial [Bacillariaceae sp.]